MAATGGVMGMGGAVATGGTTTSLPRDAGVARDALTKIDLPPDACTVDMYGKVTTCAVILGQTPPLVFCPWNMNCSVASCESSPSGPTPGVLCSAGGPSCACTR